ncbi:MAG: aspartate aminotransferase family protein [Deltaproteobacteria bacterium]|nr:aspartate aminotransferase family protein [Deltaproteobacteria bacterium]
MEMLEKYGQFLLPVLPFRDIVITRGKGSTITDANGDTYLDVNSGQYCAALGHSNPEVASLLLKIANKIQDTDTATLSEEVLLCAEKLHHLTPEMNSRIIFLSTGAEANECALRYAKHIKERPGIIAFEQGYHGLTHGTAGYSMSRHRIRPPLPHSYTISAPQHFGTEPGDFQIEEQLSQFKDVLAKYADQIAAAIFEPIVSGGGMIFPDARFFKRIRELCNQFDVFMVFDECQTGFGRTGKLFHYQNLGVVPDFVVAAKAIGLGYPVACVLANGHTVTHEHFLMQHYSSHQNEPFAAALMAFGLDTIQSQGLLESNVAKGQKLLGIFNRLEKSFNCIRNGRGVGLMGGFDLFVEGVDDYRATGTRFCNLALENKLLLQHCNNGRTIRFLPNFYISDDDFRMLESKLNCTLQAFLSE